MAIMEKQLDRKETNSDNAEVICGKLKNNAETESAEILERARKEASDILGRARDEAARQAETFMQRVEQEAALLCEKIVSSGKLEKKRVFLEERGRLISAVFDAVHQAALGFRDSPEYPVFLKKLICEGAGMLEDASLHVIFPPDDGGLFGDGFRAEVQSACAEAVGAAVALSFYAGDFRDIGVIVRTESGSRIFDGRFSSLLQQRYDEFYGKIMKEMF